MTTSGPTPSPDPTGEPSRENPAEVSQPHEAPRAPEFGQGNLSPESQAAPPASHTSPLHEAPGPQAPTAPTDPQAQPFPQPGAPSAASGSGTHGNASSPDAAGSFGAVPGGIPAPPKKTKSKALPWIIGIIVGVLLLLIAAIVGAIFVGKALFGAGPEATVEKAITAVENLDCPALKDTVEPKKASTMNCDDLEDSANEKLIQQMKDAGLTLDAGETTTKGDTATSVVTVSVKDPASGAAVTFPVNVTLKKFDGEWKITDVDAPQMGGNF